MYQAIFVNVDGLEATDVGAPRALVSTTREEAWAEAWSLPRPEGANFIKLVREGRSLESRGFAL